MHGAPPFFDRLFRALKIEQPKVRKPRRDHVWGANSYSVAPLPGEANTCDARLTQYPDLHA